MTRRCRARPPSTPNSRARSYDDRECSGRYPGAPRWPITSGVCGAASLQATRGATEEVGRGIRSEPSHSRPVCTARAASDIVDQQHRAVQPVTWSVRAVALDNPAFNNPAFQDSKAAKTYPGRPGLQPPAAQTQTASAQHAGVDAAAQAQLEGMYAAPSAGAVETDRMTVEDTVWKTVGLFAVLVVTAVVGWAWTMAPVASNNPPTLVPWIVGMLGGFVLSLVVIFTSRKKIRPGADLRLRGLRGPLRRRHLRVLREPVGRHRPAGDARHALGRRRHARPLRERQGPRLEEGHQDLHDRDGRLPGVLAAEPRPHLDGHQHRPMGSSSAERSRESRSD